MGKPPSPDQQRAFILWCQSGRTKKPAELAAELGISARLISKWKSVNKWDEQPDPGPKRRGPPKGSKNAKGNKGGAGGPPGNDKAVKHGLFRKFMPQDGNFLEIMDMVSDMDPLEMMWQNIVTQFTAIIRAPQIMHVTGKDEMIKELKKQKFEVHSTGRGASKELHQVVVEEEHEFQFAWDRYATYLKAQSAAMAELRGAIKQFLNAAPENDERRAKLALMQAQVEKVKSEANKASKGNDKTPLRIEIDYGSEDEES